MKTEIEWVNDPNENDRRDEESAEGLVAILFVVVPPLLCCLVGLIGKLFFW